MNISRFTVLALCLAPAACGEQFVAHAGSAASGGVSGAGSGAGAKTVDEAGAGGGAGSDDSSDAGQAGSEMGGSGGAPASAGATGLSGAGGALIEPLLPPLGLALWLRADRGIQQTDGHVQVWQDQSGNQTNATQLTANVRPTYLATGFNGRPTLEFDGQGQFLKFAVGFGDFSKGSAAFVVAKPTKADCASMLEFSNGSEIEDVSFGTWESKWTYEVGAAYIQTASVDQARFSLYSVNHRLTGRADLRIGGSAVGHARNAAARRSELRTS
ncbi:MAG TPA: hypothetical protein VJV79_35085 [Polyangiaceae bacterium]|nr:hypothetical protein [Polyangiaceae bacterium]